MDLYSTTETITPFDQIKKNIRNWNVKRKIFPIQLSTVLGFKINRSDVENWSSQNFNINNIHCYIGINENNTMEMYLVDNITDENGQYELNINLIQKECITNKLDFYYTDNNHPVFFMKFENPTEFSNSYKAECRIANWMIWSYEWLELQKINDKELLQVITVPFADIKTLFNKDLQIESINAIFALKYFKETTIANPEEPIGYNIEIILSNNDIKVSEVSGPAQDAYFDVAKPRPPFKTALEGLNLLPE